MTNFEKITADSEILSKFIKHTFMCEDCDFCPVKMFCYISDESCTELIADWLDDDFEDYDESFYNSVIENNFEEE